MEEIFSAFGINVKLIVIQIINFGLLLFALWYFLYTPVLRLLDERQKKIQKGLEDADAAEKSLKEAGLTKDEIVASAHHESAEIVKKAERYAEKKKETIIENAEDTGQGIVKNAEKEAAEKTKKIHADAEREIAQAAVLAAERLIIEKVQ